MSSNYYTPSRLDRCKGCTNYYKVGSPCPFCEPPATPPSIVVEQAVTRKAPASMRAVPPLRESETDKALRKSFNCPPPIEVPNKSLGKCDAGLVVAPPSPVNLYRGSAIPASPSSASKTPRGNVGRVDRKELCKRYDLVVIGGGPAGVAGALKAAYLGRRSLIIDRPKIAPDCRGVDVSFGGPTGLFSKALRDIAKTLDIKSLRAQKLDDDVIWKQVQNMCGRLASNNAESQLNLAGKFKVGYLQGTATLKKAGTAAGEPQESGVEVEVELFDNSGFQTIQTDKVLVCTGSTPIRLPGTPFDNVRVFDADSIFYLSFLPRSVAIVGSGIVAIEFAKIFRKLGAKVTMLVRGNVMSALERIGIDTDIAKALIRGLKEDDVSILEDTAVKDFVEVPTIAQDPCQILLDTKGKEPYILEVDIFLAATGRTPQTKGFGLEDIGAEITKRGHITTKETLETTCPGVYAAGDAIEGAALASTGVEQAQRAVAAAFGTAVHVGSGDFPVGVWTVPEMAYYGMTLPKAKAKGYDAEEGMAQYDACLRGRVFSPDGLLKLVFDKGTHVILGVHIIGTDACEMVHYGMDLVERRATIFDVISTLYTAVTFHELFKEAALDANSKLEFGIQWQEILSALSTSTPAHQLVNSGVLRAKFDEIDTDGDGSLDNEELQNVFKNLGHPVAPSIITQLIRLADDDGNGTIEWPEFERIFEVLAALEAKGPPAPSQ